MKAVACGLILTSFVIDSLSDLRSVKRDAFLVRRVFRVDLIVTNAVAGLDLCGSLLLLSNGLVITFTSRGSQPLAVTMAMLFVAAPRRRHRVLIATSLNKSPKASPKR